MKWSKPVPCGQPLLHVHLAGFRAAQDDGSQPAGNPRLEQAAYERGLRNGEKRLSEQLLRQRRELMELQNGVLASLRQALPQVARQCESDLIELAIEVATRLVCGLPISAQMVEAAIRSALAQVQESAELEVALHADDLALLQQCNSPVLLPGPGNERIHFRASPEVTRGGCLVQTRFGLLDARRETKLELIRQSLAQ